jgi:hypothetical protein
LQDEWPCKGPDVKGRARPGPNILKPRKPQRGTKSTKVSGKLFCALCASLWLSVI